MVRISLEKFLSKIKNKYMNLHLLLFPVLVLFCIIGGCYMSQREKSSLSRIWSCLLDKLKVLCIFMVNLLRILRDMHSKLILLELLIWTRQERSTSSTNTFFHSSQGKHRTQNPICITKILLLSRSVYDVTRNLLFVLAA